MIALVVSCALMMNMIDATVLGTALPAIATDFGSDPVSMNLTMSVYLLMLAVFIPLSGWMADKYGTKPVFLVAISVFMISSVLCGLANSQLELVAARALQGASGALTLPVARLVLLKAAPKEALVQAMIWVTIPALIGPLIGPPLGGFLVTYASWRWIFWINVPIGLIGLVMALAYFENSKEEDVSPLDWKGFLLIAPASILLLVGIEALAYSDQNPVLPAGFAAVSLLLFALYVRHAARRANPIIDLKLLSEPTFRASVSGGTLFRFGIGAFPFLMPLMLQEGFGHTALQSGMITFTTAAGALLMKFVAPRALARYGFRGVLVPNTVVVALSMFVICFFTANTPYWLMGVVLLFGGFFRSLQFTAINSLGFSELDKKQMSRATSFSAMAQQLSLTVGVGVGALALNVSMSLRGSTQLEPTDFIVAFATISLLMLVSLFEFTRLKPEDGAEAAKHKPTTVGGISRPPSDSRT
nr:MDR family MFS transporter [Pseudovibrio flavus]